MTGSAVTRSGASGRSHASHHFLLFLFENYLRNREGESEGERVSQVFAGAKFGEMFWTLSDSPKVILGGEIPYILRIKVSQIRPRFQTPPRPLLGPLFDRFWHHLDHFFDKF